MEIYCPLDDQGCYVEDGQIPSELIGQSVLEKDGNISDANRSVLKLLAQKRHLLQRKTSEHSYPHCWRSKVLLSLEPWTNGS